MLGVYADLATLVVGLPVVAGGAHTQPPPGRRCPDAPRVAVSYHERRRGPWAPQRPRGRGGGGSVNLKQQCPSVQHCCLR